MDKTVNKNILQSVMESYAEEFMPVTFKFIRDNDPKHTSRLVSWLKNNMVDVLDWPAKIPDINTIKNLWEHVKKDLKGKNFKN